jgi:hypothetical protein
MGLGDIHIPSFMMIGSGIQVIFSYYLNDLKGYSVSITDGGEGIYEARN